MAKKKDDAAPADDVQPVEGTELAAPAELADSKDAEIAALKARVAELESATPVYPGGRYVVSIKDGPTATIETKGGESPADAFFRVLGIHSSPHRPEAHPAPDQAPLGVHTPSGHVRPFGGSVEAAAMPAAV